MGDNIMESGSKGSSTAEGLSKKLTGSSGKEIGSKDGELNGLMSRM
jgi:hypothetical protein